MFQHLILRPAKQAEESLEFELQARLLRAAHHIFFAVFLCYPIFLFSLSLLNLLFVVLRNCIPYTGVDVQCTSHAKACPGACDPATHRAAEGFHAILYYCHGLQTLGAESVLAMKHPWNPFSPWVWFETYSTFLLFINNHVRSRCVLGWLYDDETLWLRLWALKQSFFTGKVGTVWVYCTQASKKKNIYLWLHLTGFVCRWYISLVILKTVQQYKKKKTYHVQIKSGHRAIWYSNCHMIITN